MITVDVVPSISALHRSFANGSCCSFTFPTLNFNKGTVITQHSQSLALMSCARMGRGGEEKGGSGRSGKGIHGKDLLGSRQIKVQLQEIFKLSEFWFDNRPHYPCGLRTDNITV